MTGTIVVKQQRIYSKKDNKSFQTEKQTEKLSWAYRLIVSYHTGIDSSQVHSIWEENVTDDYFYE